MVDGMMKASKRHRKKFGVSGLPDLLHRPFDQYADTSRRDRRDAIAHRRDHVVGIGLDRRRTRRPPATFAEAYALPGAPACIAPPIAARTTRRSSKLRRPNYLICRDVLQCAASTTATTCWHRIGSWPEARRDGLYFTPAPGPAWCTIGRIAPSASAHGRRGLNVTITPTIRPCSRPTSGTASRPCSNRSAGTGHGRKFSLNSVEGSWLDESDKSALRMAFRRKIAALDKQFGYDTAAPTV